MQYVQLGQSGLKVSRLCLGTMNMGSKNWKPWIFDEKESEPIICHALDNGVNFIDLADFYSQGEGEQVVCNVLNRVARRDDLVITTIDLGENVAISIAQESFVYGLGHSTGDYYVHRLLDGERRIEDTGAAHPCDFTYVHDLALGLVQAAEAEGLPEPVYNLSGGRLLTRGDLARAVLAYFPDAVIRQTPGTDPKRHLRGVCLIERAARDFGYAPRFSLEAGIADMVRRGRERAAA